MSATNATKKIRAREVVGGDAVLARSQVTGKEGRDSPDGVCGAVVPAAEGAEGGAPQGPGRPTRWRVPRPGVKTVSPSATGEP